MQHFVHHAGKATSVMNKDDTRSESLLKHTVAIEGQILLVF